jgi:hypothetical protein
MVPNSLVKPRLCIDCIYCKTKKDKYYCKLEKFYKNSYLDIVLYTPEDFDCSDWEEAE